MPCFDFRTNQSNELTVSLNRSKSLYIRYLIGCFLKFDLILPVSDDEAEDVKFTAHALSEVKKKRNSRRETIIDINHCGTAYRFLTALLAITPGKWFLTGSERILQRPISPLVDSLNNIGADITITDKGIAISGKTLTAEKMVIDCTKSSQFASALILISHSIGLKHLMIIPLKPPSSPYINMTKKIVDKLSFGKIPSISDIEMDWSCAAFWYAAVALSDNKNCRLPGLTKESLQGDSIIQQWFSLLGVETIDTADGIFIRRLPEKITAGTLTFNLSDHPDLAPILGVLAVLKPIEMRLTGLDNLNRKESERLTIMIKELSRFAMVYPKNAGELLIIPRNSVRDKTLSFQSYQDHRFILAFLLFALYNEIEIDETASIKKSYPCFFKNPLFADQ